MSMIGGVWKEASVKGWLRNAGWGSDHGYPGIDLDSEGIEVEGYLFSSENLNSHWAALDTFEGKEYERVVTSVKVKEGGMINAYIYQLRKE